MKIVYVIVAILLLVLVENVFDLQQYTTVPLVFLLTGAFMSDFFRMRRKGKTATIVLLVLFVPLYTYVIFFQVSDIVLIASCLLGSILGSLIGAVNSSHGGD